MKKKLKKSSHYYIILVATLKKTGKTVEILCGNITINITIWKGDANI